MTSPEKSFAIRPSGPGPLLFRGPAWRYDFVEPLLEHEDFEPTVVARRKPLTGRGPGQLVFLKRLYHPEDMRHARAEEEVRLATFLHHPGIARVYELVEHEGEPYVVSEYMKGCFLETATEAALLGVGRLSPAFAAYVAAQVADALHAAHQCEDASGRALRVVHRAVSPMRIRLGRDGRVKLYDFGAAWSVLEGRVSTPPKLLRANVSYSAPEVVSFRAVDGRADLYSLGMVLLETLTGVHPLDPPSVNPPPGESEEAARYGEGVRTERPTWENVGVLTARIMRFGPEDVERVAQGIPEGLEVIIHKALRANPDERYQTGAEMREALNTWLRGQGESYGRERVAAELTAVLRHKPSPHEASGFPTERGVLLTPEQAALAEDTKRQRSRRR
ncbi:MAG TPA: serine/threonine-protein kinase [Myxococcaceae bacterium]|nr:serine/threonine-protein kinase [Myxococcaceae bacterium]